MRILVVEDHKTIGPEIVKSIEDMEYVGQVHLAKSVNGATEALKSEFYDLMVLDLGLPLEDNDPSDAVEHGQRFFEVAQDICPGMPIFVLTGSTDAAWGLRLSRFAHNIDLWGSGKTANTVDYIQKEHTDQLYKEIERVSAEVHTVNQIGIDTRGRSLKLTPGDERALRVAARKLGGSRVEVVPLSGGLSRVRVFRVRVFNDVGGKLAVLAAKLGEGSEVRAEIVAYDRDVQRLPLGTFPHRIETNEAGLCGRGAIFYQLAQDYDQTLFDLIQGDPATAATIVESLRRNMQIWEEGAQMSKAQISDVRRRVLWDSEFDTICAKFGLDLSDVESRSVDFRAGCVHGDLHGGNVLISEPPASVMIDFGDVAPGSLALDPVTLELCLIFHPDGAARGLVPDVDGYLDQWPDPDSIPRSGIGLYQHACRDWAHDVAGSDLAFLAMTYGYTVRQLRFSTVAPEVTLALLERVTSAIRRIS